MTRLPRTLLFTLTWLAVAGLVMAGSNAWAAMVSETVVETAEVESAVVADAAASVRAARTVVVRPPKEFAVGQTTGSPAMSSAEPLAASPVRRHVLLCVWRN